MGLQPTQSRQGVPQGRQGCRRCRWSSHGEGRALEQQSAYVCFLFRRNDGVTFLSKKERPKGRRSCRYVVELHMMKLDMYARAETCQLSFDGGTRARDLAAIVTLLRMTHHPLFLCSDQED